MQRVIESDVAALPELSSHSAWLRMLIESRNTGGSELAMLDDRSSYVEKIFKEGGIE